MITHPIYMHKILTLLAENLRTSRTSPQSVTHSLLLASSEYLLTARRQLSVLFGERELSIDWAAHEGLLPAPSEGVFAALLLPPPLLTTVAVLGLEALPHFPRIFRRLAAVRHPSFSPQHSRQFLVPLLSVSRSSSL